jgi:hypothetical protein
MHEIEQRESGFTTENTENTEKIGEEEIAGKDRRDRIWQLHQGEMTLT